MIEDNNKIEDTANTIQNLLRQPLPSFELNIYSNFPFQFKDISSVVYHSKQEILIIGTKYGKLYFIGGDAQYQFLINLNLNILNVEIDDYLPYLYCFCKNFENNILMIFDFVKREVIYQIKLSDEVFVMKYLKSFLILGMKLNNEVIVKYMCNLKFVQSISLQNNYNKTSEITIIEKHPNLDFILSVGYNNGDFILFYINHQPLQNNSITTTLQSIYIPYPNKDNNENISVTTCYWLNNNYLFIGYNNGKIILYEINHLQFNFNLFLILDLHLNGNVSSIFHYNILYQINNLNNNQINNQNNNLEINNTTTVNEEIILFSLNGLDKGIYYFKIDYNNKKIEYLRQIITGIDIYKCYLFRNLCCIIYNDDKNIAVIDLLQKVINPECELQFFTIEKYRNLNFENNTKDILMFNNCNELQKDIYDNVFHFNNDIYKQNIVKHYNRPNNWNIFGMKYDYNLLQQSNGNRYILVKLMEKSLDVYLCDTYCNDVKFIYRIQKEIKFISKYNKNNLLIINNDGNLEILNISTLQLFNFNHLETTIDNNTYKLENLFQSIINYNLNLNNNINDIYKIFPITLLNQLIIVYKNNCIRIIKMSENINNNNTIFYFTNSDNKINHLFNFPILPKLNNEIVTNIECSIYNNYIYIILGYNSGRVILISLYDLNKLLFLENCNNLKELNIKPFIAFNEINNSSFGKVINIFNTTEKYKLNNLNTNIDANFLPNINNNLNNNTSTELNKTIHYTIYNEKIVNELGITKYNDINFTINTENIFFILIKLNDSLSTSFQFNINPIFTIKIKTLSKIEKIAEYSIIINNNIIFTFKVEDNTKIVNAKQLGIYYFNNEIKIFTIDNASNMECIATNKIVENNLFENNNIIQNFNIIYLKNINKQEVDSVSIYNNCNETLFYNNNNNIYDHPNIIVTISTTKLPKSSSKFLFIIKEKGIEEYIIDKPFLSLKKKFTLKDNRKYLFNNNLQSSNFYNLIIDKKEDKKKLSTILLLDSNKLVCLQLKPSPVTASHKELPFTIIFSENITIENNNNDNYKINCYQNGKDIFIFNNNNIYFSTLFNSLNYKSKELLEPYLFTIDTKQLTNSSSTIVNATNAISETIGNFFKSFKKTSVVTEREMNDTFWKCCVQLLREDPTILSKVITINNTTKRKEGNNNVQEEDQERSIISKFLKQELTKFTNNNNLQQVITSSSNDNNNNLTTQPSSSSSSYETNRKLLLEEKDEDKNEEENFVTNNSSMKRSELNDQLEETKLKMQENLRKLDERGEKLREIKEKTSKLSSMASNFAANTEKLKQKSKFF
ncbi:hypothetical protein ABK040_004906 [Willaertia magna]